MWRYPDPISGQLQFQPCSLGSVKASEEYFNRSYLDNAHDIALIHTTTIGSRTDLVVLGLPLGIVSNSLLPIIILWKGVERMNLSSLGDLDMGGGVTREILINFRILIK